MTSPKGLIEFSQNLKDIQELTEKGIKVKIMAPITRDNIEKANELSKFCSVIHIPPNHSPTTIVDGKHLFHFKSNFRTKW